MYLRSLGVSTDAEDNYKQLQLTIFKDSVQLISGEWDHFP